MRPFFSYYGAKYVGARYYGPPRRRIVVEPFAGSACYSTRWDAERVELYDTSPDICDLWDFLINASERDIAEIPDRFENDDQFQRLSRGPRLLCAFWVAKGRATPAGVLSPWYFSYMDSHDCRVWGPAVKARIIKQKPRLSGWSIACDDWENIPLRGGRHWHVDPPYNNAAGKKYPHGGVDYAALGDWCRDLPGAVDVCENVGATWLPFEPLFEVVSTRGRRDGRRSKEAVWRKQETRP